MDDEAVAKYPGLYARSGVWYLRKRVPADLVHVERRSQIRLSLETADKKVAIRRYPLKLAEMEVGFEKLRTQLREQGRVPAALSSGKLEQLARRDVEGLVLRWWANREPLRHSEDNDALDPSEALHTIEQDLGALDKPHPQEPDPVRSIADQLLVQAGMAAYPQRRGPIRTKVRYPAVDRSSEQYRYLCELVGRALPLELAILRDHLLGRHDAPHDPLFHPAGLVDAGRPDGAGATRCIRDLIAEYRAEREALLGKESTDRKYGLVFRVMEEVVGPDMPVRALGRAECVRMLTFLRKLPPNCGKRFPKLTLSQAVAKAESEKLPGLAPNTVGSYMQNLAAILRWAECGGWGVKADTKDLIASRRPQIRRRGFTTNELRTLFEALEPYRRSEPTKFWVPALALFTGARAGEICQLRIEDVVDVDGVDCLNLSEFDAKGLRVEDKRLKTRTSERLVPLHSDLIDAGFLDFVTQRAQAGRLFPDLKPGPKGSFSHEFSKWFGRFKRRIGLNEPALVFHSFRHGFRDACRRADISDETAQALGGWAGVNQATHYGDRGAVPVLGRAMSKLEFGGFRLPAGSD